MGRKIEVEIPEDNEVIEKINSKLEDLRIRKLISKGFRFNNQISINELNGVKKLSGEDNLGLVDRGMVACYGTNLDVDKEKILVKINLDYVKLAIEIGMTELIVLEKDYPIVCKTEGNNTGILVIAPRVGE